MFYTVPMIIGITGTLGAGKGTVVDYLVKTRGFKHFSVRDFLNEEIAKRGLVSNRDNMLLTANDLRGKHGSGYIVEELFKRALNFGGNAVIESVRSVGEAEHLHLQAAHLWAVDADIHTRYERITKRQSETDQVTFEKFKADEEAEFANEDPTKPNLQALIKQADVVLSNDGTEEELFAQVKKALSVN